MQSFKIEKGVKTVSAGVPKVFTPSVKQNNAFTREHWGKVIFGCALAKKNQENQIKSARITPKLDQMMLNIETKINNLASSPETPEQIKQYIASCQKVLKEVYLPAVKQLSQPETLGFHTSSESNDKYVDFLANLPTPKTNDTYAYVLNVPHVSKVKEFALNEEDHARVFGQIMAQFEHASKQMATTLDGLPKAEPEIKHKLLAEQLGEELPTFLFWCNNFCDMLNGIDFEPEEDNEKVGGKYNKKESSFEKLQKYLKCNVQITLNHAKDIVDFFKEVHRRFFELEVPDFDGKKTTIVSPRIFYIVFIYKMWQERLIKKYGESMFPNILTPIDEKTQTMTWSIVFGDEGMTRYFLKLATKSLVWLFSLFSIGWIQTAFQSWRDPSTLPPAFKDYFSISTGLSRVGEDAATAKEYVERYFAPVMNNTTDVLKQEAMEGGRQVMEAGIKTVEKAQSYYMTEISSFEADAQSSISDAFTRASENMEANARNRVLNNVVICASKFAGAKEYLLDPSNKKFLPEQFKNGTAFEYVAGGDIFTNVTNSTKAAAKKAFYDYCYPLIVGRDALYQNGNYSIFDQSGREWAEGTMTRQRAFIAKDLLQKVVQDAAIKVSLQDNLIQFASTSQNINWRSAAFEIDPEFGTDLELITFRIQQENFKKNLQYLREVVANTTLFMNEPVTPEQLTKMSEYGAKIMPSLKAIIATKDTMIKIMELSLEQPIPEGNATEFKESVEDIIKTINGMSGVAEHLSDFFQKTIVSIKEANEQCGSHVASIFKNMAAFWGKTANWTKWSDATDIVTELDKKEASTLASNFDAMLGYLSKKSSEWIGKVWNGFSQPTTTAPFNMKKGYFEFMMFSSFNFDLELMAKTCKTIAQNAIKHAGCLSVTSSNTTNWCKHIYTYAHNFVTMSVYDQMVHTIMAAPMLTIRSISASIDMIKKDLNNGTLLMQSKEIREYFHNKMTDAGGHPKQRPFVKYDPVNQKTLEHVADNNAELQRTLEEKPPMVPLGEQRKPLSDMFGMNLLREGVSMASFIFEVNSVYNGYAWVLNSIFWLLSFPIINTAIWVLAAASVLLGGGALIHYLIWGKKATNKDDAAIRGGKIWASIWATLLGMGILGTGVIMMFQLPVVAGTMWATYSAYYMLSIFTVGITGKNLTLKQMIECLSSTFFSFSAGITAYYTMHEFVSLFSSPDALNAADFSLSFFIACVGYMSPFIIGTVIMYFGRAVAEHFAAVMTKMIPTEDEPKEKKD